MNSAPSEVGGTASFGVNPPPAADVLAERGDHAHVGDQEIGIVVRIAAADHRQVDPIGQPLVTQRRKLDQFGSQRFESLERVRKVAAKRFVLGVRNAETSTTAIAAMKAGQIRHLGKRAPTR